MKVVLAFIVFAIISCSSSKENNKSKVKNTFETAEIESVYYQKWIAGIQGGGNGINFHVIFKEPLDEEYTLDSVIFQTKNGIFEKISETEYLAKIDTHQNDLILDENPQKEYGNKTPDDKNLKSKDIIIFYRIKSSGKLKAFQIENVKEKPMIAYPSRNKQKN